MSTVIQFWVLAGILLSLTLFILVGSLRTKRKFSQEEEQKDYRASFHKRRLLEVDNDIRTGLLELEQAEDIRLEIQHHMLRITCPNYLSEDSSIKASVDSSHRDRKTRLLYVTLIFTILPVGTISFYLNLGSPSLPDQTAASTLIERKEIEQVVETLAQHMEKNPEKIDGWLLLARSQRKLGQYVAAARSFHMAIERGASDCDTFASYGEMVVRNFGGQRVPAEAQEAFRRAYLTEPDDPRAAFYLGLAASQEGDPRRAVAIWKELEAKSPQDAPWLDILRRHIDLTAEQADLIPSAITPISPVE